MTTLQTLPTPSAIALNQMSEQDRSEILRLKEKYGMDTLAQAMFDVEPPSGKSSFHEFKSQG
jgi:hypothetical protein